MEKFPSPPWVYSDARRYFQRANNCHDESRLFGNCILLLFRTSFLELEFTAQLSLTKLLY
ncbi:unnamed protein product [Brassica oleracea var. botrytis]|uniref:Uncharacterized protein n=2 Tax=Brassica TaxID=3705 RepID=A0A3P6AK99_BRAOL|nr:unnamed protein product [Brassica napus]CDY67057.1 BnaC03g74170D [Brassica napus]VDC94286.1 unnamed protein product [Brassica oleracea]